MKALWTLRLRNSWIRDPPIFSPALSRSKMSGARSQAGQNPDGEPLVTYRSPRIMRDGPPGVSFLDWTEADPLQVYLDDVSGFELYSHGCFPDDVGQARPEDTPGRCPDHPGFVPSFVEVPMPAIPTNTGLSDARIP